MVVIDMELRSQAHQSKRAEEVMAALTAPHTGGLLQQHSISDHGPLTSSCRALLLASRKLNGSPRIISITEYSPYYYY